MSGQALVRWGASGSRAAGDDGGSGVGAGHLGTEGVGKGLVPFDACLDGFFGKLDRYASRDLGGSLFGLSKRPVNSFTVPSSARFVGFAIVDTSFQTPTHDEPPKVIGRIDSRSLSKSDHLCGFLFHTSPGGICGLSLWRGAHNEKRGEHTWSLLPQRSPKAVLDRKMLQRLQVLVSTEGGELLGWKEAG